MTFLKSLCAALLLVSAIVPAAAQESEPSAPLKSRSQQLADVLRGDRDAAAIFGPQFLAEVPPSRFAQIAEQIAAQYGEFVGVERVEPSGPFSGVIHLRFKTAVASGPFTLDPNPPHKIAGLMLTSFVPIDDNLDAIRADLDALPGDVSVLFTSLEPGVRPVIAMETERQMAIGSAFKLYVLAALARSIEAGEVRWSDVVSLDMRSFPSGTMHLWPAGAPVTLQTLATQMISGSDNTATDMLINVIGRESIEAEVLASNHDEPSGLIPLLSTLELFALKGSAANRAKYLAADDAGKRRILADFQDDVGGDPGKIVPPRFSSPTAIDTIEWFASTRDLARIFERMIELQDPVARQILAIYPALPGSLVEKWSYAGYKGGSEPGVLNLSWLLQDTNGQWHVLAMTWNNADDALDHSRLELIAQRILLLQAG